jgi:chromosome segregation ATPase
MVANGNGANPYAGMTGAQLVAAIKREEREEREAEARRHREALEAELAAVNEKLAKLTAEPPLVRSKMSALEKSRYIQAHGKAKYDSLPWA